MRYEVGCILILLSVIPGTMGESTVVPVVATSIVSVFLLALVILLIVVLCYWRNKIDGIDKRRRIREEYRRIYAMNASQQSIMHNEKFLTLTKTPSEYSYRAPRDASVRSVSNRPVSDFTDKADTWIVENKSASRYDTKEQTMNFDDEDVVIVTDVVGGSSPDPLSSGIPISSSARPTSTTLYSSAMPTSTVYSSATPISTNFSSSDRPISTTYTSSARPVSTTITSSDRHTSGEITVTTITSPADPLTQLSDRQRNLATIGNVDDVDDVVVDFKRNDVENSVLY